jgi:hypothetical protein
VEILLRFIKVRFLFVDFFGVLDKCRTLIKFSQITSENQKKILKQNPIKKFLATPSKFPKKDPLVKHVKTQNHEKCFPKKIHP